MTNLNPLTAIGLTAAAVVLVVGTWWVRGWVEPDEESTMTVEFIQRTMTRKDVPEPTEPKTVVKYKEPDSSNTRTDCITVPTWLDTLESTSRLTTLTPGLDSVESKPDSGAGGRGSDNTHPTSPNLRTDLRGLPYVITPMTQGSPSLSVESQQVTLSSINPQTGAGMTFEYQVPRPEWTLTAQGTVQAGRAVALGSSALHVEHRSDGWALGIGPAVMAAVTSDGYTADVGVSLSIRKTLWSR